MTTMTKFDFAPLYRHAVGFDRFANMAQKLVEQQLAAQRISDACKAKKRAANNEDAKNTMAANKITAKTDLQSDRKVVKSSADTTYPRYNISQMSETDYQITLALAGFSLEEIDITVTASELVITGEKLPLKQTSTLLHQGINQTNFSRKFALADHVHVVNADMHQGLLTINLNREIPEALQPRKIVIGR
ncbi:Hsp20 family protein [Moritella marina ATCC 15381]|uniref:Hsp20 family protein n=1 Tax=Moritella marina ATCC 15381 TaxID=1202962 RepID=A0A5J6WGK2_MORMI|nr:Hsp20 family protein [Moritella marina]QFI37087.1 Hsp20 family protein [Moritella marina ATCC 15381]